MNAAWRHRLQTFRIALLAVASLTAVPGQAQVVEACSYLWALANPRIDARIKTACAAETTRRFKESRSRKRGFFQMPVVADPTKIQTLLKTGLCGVSVVGSHHLDKMIQEYLDAEAAEGRDDAMTRLGGHYVTGLRYLLMADACARAFFRKRLTRQQIVTLVGSAHIGSHLSRDETNELTATVGSALSYAIIVEGQEAMMDAAFKHFCKAKAPL